MIVDTKAFLLALLSLQAATTAFAGGESDASSSIEKKILNQHKHEKPHAHGNVRHRRDLAPAPPATKPHKQPRTVGEHQTTIQHFSLGEKTSTSARASTFESSNSNKPNYVKPAPKAKSSNILQASTTEDEGDASQAMQGRIVGGTTVTSPSSYPYYVNIGGCGASLIGPSVVLSAAHCGPNGSEYLNQNVRVGAYQASGDGQVRTVSQQVNQPNYNDATLQNDFMLLRLSSPVNINSIPTLTLSNDPADFAENTPLTVMGLGTLSAGGSTPNTLQEVTVQSNSVQECQAAYGTGEEGFDQSVMICASQDGGGKDSCQGDSGGPLVRIVGNEHRQVGIVSWGIDCADAQYPGVYSKVAGPTGYNWIKSVVCDQWGETSSICGNAPAPAPGPGPAPTAAPAPSGCSGGLTPFEVTINADDYPEETSWSLTQGGIVVDSSNSATSKTVCLASGTYQFTINDSYGDGLCCEYGNGSYKGKLNGSQIFSGGAFGSSETQTFSVGNAGPSPTNPPVPSPTNPPTPSPTNPPTPSPTNPPTPTPTPQPTPSPTPQPTPAPGPSNGCPSGQIKVEFDLTLDSWPDETEWEIFTAAGQVVMKGGPYAPNQAGQTIQATQCVPDTCLSLSIYDAYGDGLSGNYNLMIDGQPQLAQVDGEQFNDVVNHFFNCDQVENGACMPLVLDLVLDSYPEETSFYLIDMTNQIFEWDESSFNTPGQAVQYTTCLNPNKCYILEAFDSYGDGIVGTFKLALDNQVVFDDGPGLGYGQVFRFGC
mmetsp:Transcript_9121/g.23082  ORF Transcript_9121/g.23082 Transcript_9121/m.23082 type:complete len:766 (-) Transcript_9121:220-2517(-)